MNQKKIKIYGISIYNIIKREVLDEINRVVRENKKESMMFLNANNFVIANNDSNYLKDINSIGYVFADGVGLKFASRINGHSLVDNINGTDLFPMLCSMCEKDGIKMYLLGSKSCILQSLITNLKQEYPRLKINGYQDGYFDHWGDNKIIIEKINKSKSDLLLIGLGSPLQEKWISKYFEQINCNVTICVGGLFDFYSGNIKRAPKMIRNMGLNGVFVYFKNHVGCGKDIYGVSRSLFLLF